MNPLLKIALFVALLLVPNSKKEKVVKDVTNEELQVKKKKEPEEKEIEKELEPEEE